ncbi:toll-like receptor 4 [Ostrea edulis]|uniref:toll-like receptor 4 n=1 Tax=Ostrea edulis TaxID=37623 RepID=UPI0024AEFF5E|nr:toll-like receptor 4 [Ostrea edulis]
MGIVIFIGILYFGWLYKSAMCRYMDENVPCCSVNQSRNGVVVNCRYMDNGTECEIPPNVTDLVFVKNKLLTPATLDFLCFKNFTRLSYINVSDNDLRAIPKGCFGTFPVLQTLDISGNNKLGLQNLYNACVGLNNTNITILKANFINNVDILLPVYHNLSTLLSDTSLKEIYFEYDEISVIESGVIKTLPKSLEILSVRGNRLSFSIKLLELRLMTNLKKLDISFQCTQLLRRKYAPAWKDTHNCSVFGVTEGNVLKVLPPNLEELISIETGSGSFCFPKLSPKNTSLKYVDLSGSDYFSWVGPLNISKDSNHLETLILSNNKCSNISDGFFANLNQLKKLDISQNVLGTFFPGVTGGSVFKGLVSLETLNMAENLIDNLPSDLLKYQSNLKILVVSYNNMESLTLSVSHMKNLQSIDCSYNKLVSLPKSLQTDLDAIVQDHPVHVVMTNNKIICACDNLEFISWMSETKVNFSMPYIKCSQSNGASIDIMNAYEDLKISCKRAGWISAAAQNTVIVVTTFFILACVSGVLLYNKRWTITYRWYLFRLRHKGYSPIDGKNDEFQFDAFLSFAEEDFEFVKDVIEELENRSEDRYRLCFHHRDFIPGTSIASNIVSAIHHSRKTIIFMSHAFLNSTWCKYELQMSITKEVETNSDVIIMIVLDNIPKNKMSLEVLRYYRKNCYLEKPEGAQDRTLLWKTLRESLKDA